ncbi:hypothetical protein [Methanoplanus endosymbiosus]|uniref:Uncharacterized protein n=1 Tax=Methanoplanus endosymbiosus TaxID=33865 RepID=A0A9E7THN2_9EURY|nr:hypothetical protein [Methanoplanus endosymbiosus]UUX93267.1 hypothetical protein L6E24_03840 [Methanoplanus endosymbiosus]
MRRDILILCVCLAMCLSGSASAVKVIPWDEMQQLQNTEPETCESCVLPVLPWLCLVGGAGIFGYLFFLPKYEAMRKRKEFEKLMLEYGIPEHKIKRGRRT